MSGVRPHTIRMTISWIADKDEKVDETLASEVVEAAFELLKGRSPSHLGNVRPQAHTTHPPQPSPPW